MFVSSVIAFSYDPQGSGSITHSTFLDRLAAGSFAPPDDRFGEGGRLIEANDETLDVRRQKLLDDQDCMAERQAQRGQFITTTELYNTLK